jgi:glc operon protein GlcG
MKRPSTIALLAAACMLPATQALAAQLDERPGLTLDGARAVIVAARAEAERLGAPGGVIAVVDDGGNLMALERIDGTFAAGANVSIGKARTAALFKKPTRVFEETINKGRTAMAALGDFTPLQGGVPIEVAGRVVGGVGVSGAASAAQDEEIALAGAAAARMFTSHGVATSASSRAARRAALPVSHFDHARVQQAFARGDVLLDGKDGRNYMIHASRRDAPGVAEVHTKDADLIYVVSGSATFVTGGEVVDAKTVAPDELRGPSIRGGEERRIVAGDVLVVPNGTPHWFREVPEPLTYYVVKVR